MTEAWEQTYSRTSRISASSVTLPVLQLLSSVYQFNLISSRISQDATKNHTYIIASYRATTLTWSYLISFLKRWLMLSARNNHFTHQLRYPVKAHSFHR